MRSSHCTHSYQYVRSSTAQTNELLVSQSGAIDKIKSGMKSLRRAYPNNDVPGSIISSTRSVEEMFNDASSTLGAEEFTFDDEVVNSKAYRRVLAAARNHHPKEPTSGPSNIQQSLYAHDDEVAVDLPIPHTPVSPAGAETILINEASPAMYRGNIRPVPRITFLPGSSNTNSASTAESAQRGLQRLSLEAAIGHTKQSDSFSVNSETAKNTELMPTTLTNSTPNFTPNRKKFGNYILGHIIHDGRSKIKIARLGTGNGQYALKLYRRPPIPPEGYEDLQVLKEINVVRQLSHPNVARIIEMVETAWTFGLVFEFLPGGTLEEYVIHHQYLKDRMARPFFAQLISAVRYLQEKEIVHLNIRTQTILLDRNQNIVLCGFGYSEQYLPLSEETFSDWQQCHDSVSIDKAKHTFMAPELVTRPTRTLGYPHADVWSCGVVLVSVKTRGYRHRCLLTISVLHAGRKVTMGRQSRRMQRRDFCSL